MVNQTTPSYKHLKHGKGKVWVGDALGVSMLTDSFELELDYDDRNVFVAFLKERKAKNEEENKRKMRWRMRREKRKKERKDERR